MHERIRLRRERVDLRGLECRVGHRFALMQAAEPRFFHGPVGLAEVHELDDLDLT